VCHEPKEVAKFRDVQSAVLIPVGHLKFRFDKPQQLSFADCAFVFAVI